MVGASGCANRSQPLRILWTDVVGLVPAEVEDRRLRVDAVHDVAGGRVFQNVPGVRAIQVRVAVARVEGIHHHEPDGVGLVGIGTLVDMA